jgi:hypothetical protein
MEGIGMKFPNLFLFASCICGSATAADQLASMCPAASKAIQASCREITYKDLPAKARALLQKLKCEVRPGSNYDYGNAVDLNGDGSPEYQFCCHEAPHGPCGSVLMGKVGNEWKDLTAKQGLLGFDGVCTGFVILESRRAGFHDVCLPNECSPAPAAKSSACAPAIWQYDNGRYHSVDAPAAKSPK